MWRDGIHCSKFEFTWVPIHTKVPVIIIEDKEDY